MRFHSPQGRSRIRLRAGVHDHDERPQNRRPRIRAVGKDSRQLSEVRPHAQRSHPATQRHHTRKPSGIHARRHRVLNYSPTRTRSVHMESRHLGGAPVGSRVPRDRTGRAVAPRPPPALLHLHHHLEEPHRRLLRGRRPFNRILLTANVTTTK